MAEQRKPRKKSQKKTYTYRPNSVCVTLYASDGKPVPRSVLDEAADSITKIAIKYGLLINTAEA